MNSERINPNSSTTPQPRLPYAKPELVDLNLVRDTEGKPQYVVETTIFGYGPS